MNSMTTGHKQLFNSYSATKRLTYCIL
uniref:Uncharacterized protein n=1 Tax=Arundo donax TaxID=35708 RepID=A0A0A9ACX1_ARUDO